MMKTLIQKQLAETLSIFTGGNRKKGKNSLAIKALYVFLMLYVAVVLFAAFFLLMDSICKPFFDAGLGWLYFSFAVIISTVIGIFGSIFMTQAQLFDARDNEFLLSLPIPPSKILFARMLSVYIQDFIFEAVVLIPSFIVYFINCGFVFPTAVFIIISLFALPFFGLALTCLLGWFIAIITSKMRNKNLFNIILSIAFLAAYFYIYPKFNTFISYLINNGYTIGQRIKSVVYPIYLAGSGISGNFVHFVILIVSIAVLFSFVYWLLSHSFIKIATTNRGKSSKKVNARRAESYKESSQAHALFKKELRRFTSSYIYLLNCGLGVILMVAASVAILIKADDLSAAVTFLPFTKEVLCLIICAILCFIASMNAVTAPSISLEGASLALTKTLPISGMQILRAKLKLHLAVTCPILFLLCISTIFVLNFSFFDSLMIIIIPQLFTLMCGQLGLIFNLKFPNLTWNSESVAVKQSSSVIFSMLSSYAIMTAFIILYFLTKKYLPEGIFGIIAEISLIFITFVFQRYLDTKGVKKLEFLE